MNEKCLLVIIDSFKSIELNNNIEEMILLCESAKVEIVDKITFKRSFIDSNTYIGKGQTEFLSNVVYNDNISIIIFSKNLNPIQIRNLEKITNKRIIDRTQLILDIFSQRAKSNEGKIQVELAQLEYLLPRLTGKGIEMSRISGGAGFAARGPGETKLETNKRKIRERIKKLKDDLKAIEKQRKISSKNRLSSNIPIVSIIGYTSAGKSTLLNSLSNENFYTDSMLFATLDSVTRKILINKNLNIFLTDTVGFLQNLPHNLIAAFKSTLEETLNADILIHLIDSSKENIEDNIYTVNNTLNELNIKNKKILMVFNKIDLISREKHQQLYYKYPNSIFISAKEKTGLSNVLKNIEKYIINDFKHIKVIIPYNEKNISLIYNYGKIIKQEYLNNGIYFELYIQKNYIFYFQDYIV